MWNKIFGHKKQILELSNALKANRLPNGYIFHGPGGIGKFTVAKTFCAHIACVGDVKPCGECPACKKVMNSIHPDIVHVSLLEKSTRITIVQIRELGERLKFHPLEASKKMALIDDAHLMTESSANSLLKLLEEPPSNTHFILITKQLGAMLPTIRSRCQKISFSLPSCDDVKAALLQMGKSEDEALTLARFSDGSIGKASSISTELIDEVINRFSSLSKSSSSADIIEAAELFSQKDDAIASCEILLRWHMAQLKKNTDPHHFVLNQIEKLLETSDCLSTAANKQLLFEDLLFNLCRI